MLENTSSLMLMGYLIRTHEEKNTQSKQTGLGVTRSPETGDEWCAEARQLPREPVRERRPCSSICTRIPTSPRVATWIRARSWIETAMFGLDGVAFTETNTQDGCDELFEIGAKSKVKVFVGLGLITDRGRVPVLLPKPELAPSRCRCGAATARSPGAPPSVCRRCAPWGRHRGPPVRPGHAQPGNGLRALAERAAVRRGGLQRPGEAERPTTWPWRPPRPSSCRAPAAVTPGARWTRWAMAPASRSRSRPRSSS